MAVGGPREFAPVHYNVLRYVRSTFTVTTRKINTGTAAPKSVMVDLELIKLLDCILKPCEGLIYELAMWI